MNVCTLRNASWTLVIVVVLSALAACSSLPRTPQRNEQTYRTDPVPNYVDTKLSRAEVEQMLAPIALYPNEVLVLVLAASTCPDDVLAAAQWAQAHPDLTGNDAYRAALDQSWDPAVTSLTAFPGILQMMSAQIDWTRRLGDTFLAQAYSVADASGDLRQRAMASGAFEGAADDIFVFDGTGDIVIGHGFRGYYYIPSCNPVLAYGSWPWSDYPPADANIWVYQYDWAACNWHSHIHVDRRVLHNHRLLAKHHDRDHHHPCPPRQSLTWTPGAPANRHPSTQFWTADSHVLRDSAPPTLLSRTAVAQVPFTVDGAQTIVAHYGSGRGGASGGAHMGSVFHMSGSLSSSTIRSGGPSMSSGSSSSTASSHASVSFSSGGSVSSGGGASSSSASSSAGASRSH